MDAGHLSEPGRGYFKTEVVSLRLDTATVQGYLTCPPDPTMRAGWRASAGHACRCVAGDVGWSAALPAGGASNATTQHVRLHCDPGRKAGKHSLVKSRQESRELRGKDCRHAPFVVSNVSFAAVSCNE